MKIRSNHWINRQRDMVNGVQSCELDLTVPKGANGQVGIEVVFEYEDGTTKTRFIDLY